MPIHDFECPRGHFFEAKSQDGFDWLPCPEHKDHSTMVFLPKRQGAVAFAKDETAVVWEHPGTGDIKYPGLSTAPMPVRYQQQGYVRRELRTDQDYAKFEKQAKVLSERRWFDRGSGKSFDGDGRLPERGHGRA